MDCENSFREHLVPKSEDAANVNRGKGFGICYTKEAFSYYAPTGGKQHGLTMFVANQLSLIMDQWPIISNQQRALRLIHDAPLDDV